ncbi:hypothetical protein QCD79_33455, partial [Pseudomonas quasicaspiana]|nr:hypothetical protein [Pseudomonas quasicaspiana]
LTKQYAKLFEMEGVDLEFRTDALKSVARRALERKTGDGLQSVGTELEVHTFHLEQLGVLLGQRILRLGQNLH